jgi:CRISPR-associated RAMP protein (TIGR02581 family)
MFRALLNYASLRFTFEPDGPLLVRAGSGGHDPVRPDMSPIRTRHARGETVYVPGSSLKGALRSHAERLLTSVGEPVCDVFSKDSSCQKSGRGAPSDVFAASCRACRTFGSLQVAGRARVGDAYPTEATWDAANQTEMRNGVGIDRRTQSAKGGALFDVEVVTSGRFEACLDLQNYELWQLALCLQAVDDLGEGMLQVGGLKSRGAGSVRLTSCELEFGDASAGGATLRGAGSLVDDATRRAWQLVDESAVQVAGALPGRKGLCPTHRLEGLAGARRLLDDLGEQAWSLLRAEGRT